MQVTLFSIMWFMVGVYVGMWAAKFGDPPHRDV